MNQLAHTQKLNACTAEARRKTERPGTHVAQAGGNGVARQVRGGLGFGRLGSGGRERGRLSRRVLLRVLLRLLGLLLCRLLLRQLTPRRTERTCRAPCQDLSVR